MSEPRTDEATESAWAERLAAKREAYAAKETSRAQRVAAVLGIAALVAWAAVADIPLVPDP